MTPILDNSLLSQKDKLSGMIKRAHMNVYIFTLKHSQSNVFFLFLFLNFYALLVVYGILTKYVA